MLHWLRPDFDSDADSGTAFGAGTRTHGPSPRRLRALASHLVVIVLVGACAGGRGSEAPPSREHRSDAATRPAAPMPRPTPPAPIPGPPAAAATALPAIVAELRAEFDAWLAQPAEYARRVRDECRPFPEGDLFPFTLPAMAYANLALAEPARREALLAPLPPLLDEAVRATERRLGVPVGGLAALSDTRGHGVYAGQLALALASFRLAGGDDRHEALRRRLSDLLATMLEQADGRPIRSFPSYTWTFDTIPALAALSIDDRLGGTARTGPLLSKHLAWLREHASDPATGLPRSMVSQGGRAISEPRGCELSWRTALLTHLDPPAATDLYRRYVAAFWLDRGAFAGFAEWPHGGSRQDRDSGPIVLGIGTAATALGLGAALAQSDVERSRRLDRQFGNAQALLPLLLRAGPGGGRRLGGMIDYDPAYRTGFLYGDCTLLYSATWQPWPGDTGTAAEP